MLKRLLIGILKGAQAPRVVLDRDPGPVPAHVDEDAVALRLTREAV